MFARLSPFVAGALLLAGCVGDDVDPPAAASESNVASAASSPNSETTSPPEADELSTSTTPRATERSDPGPVRALITPTGVIVPVVAEADGAYEILTPCGNEGSLVWGTPIHQADVALDPGHGGDVEIGAQGPNGLTEKELNLTLTKATARELEERGISVVLTRTSDYRVPLAVRAAIANELEVDLMMSIHHNAPVVSPSDVPGSEVFVQSGSEESRRLGGLVYEEVVEALSAFDDVEWVSARDAGALSVINRNDEDAYGMIRRPDMPAVLAELGYLANPTEAELFATDEYIEVASVALADAIERWLETDDPGSGFVDEPRRFTPSGGTGGSNGCVDPALE